MAVNEAILMVMRVLFRELSETRVLRASSNRSKFLVQFLVRIKEKSKQTENGRNFYFLFLASLLFCCCLFVFDSCCLVRSSVGRSAFLRPALFFLFLFTYHLTTHSLTLLKKILTHSTPLNGQNSE